MKDRWTYKVRHIKDGLVKKLEEYGEDGWQLVHMKPLSDSGNMVYLKRKKEEGEA